jgi:hypothetical protein
VEVDCLSRIDSTEVEIAAGLNGDAALVVNPTNDVPAGAQVHAVAAHQKGK